MFLMVLGCGARPRDVECAGQVRPRSARPHPRRCRIRPQLRPVARASFPSSPSRQRRAGPTWRRAWCSATGYMLFLNRAYQIGRSQPRLPAGARRRALHRGRRLGRVPRRATCQPGSAGDPADRPRHHQPALARGAASLRDWRPIVLALVTGSFLGAYTIVDGLVQRAAGSPHGYMIFGRRLSRARSRRCLRPGGWLAARHAGADHRAAARSDHLGLIMSIRHDRSPCEAINLASLDLSRPFANRHRFRRHHRREYS